MHQSDIEHVGFIHCLHPFGIWNRSARFTASAHWTDVKTSDHAHKILFIRVTFTVDVETISVDIV